MFDRSIEPFAPVPKRILGVFFIYAKQEKLQSALSPFFHTSPL